MAQAAYAATSATVRTPRGTEYETIVKITSALKSGASAPFSRLVKALHDNRRLWTLLAADVSDQQNGLPEATRAQIFYLAEFVAQHTSKVLNRTDSVDVLIDINSAILRGLKPGRA